MNGLKELIDSLSKYCSRKYRINSGGCCYFTALIAEQLEKLNIKYNFVIYDYDEIEYDRVSIRDNIIHRNVAGYPNGYNTVSHYTLDVNGIGIINGHTFEDYEYKIIPNVTSKDIHWIYETGSWNDDYDVDNNEKVRNLISKKFNEYVTI